MNHQASEMDLLYVATPSEWRNWLKQNYQNREEIWLVYYKKHTGKPRIQYNDAVEEALCFGWIDSIVKSIDEDRFAQRFSRRNPGAAYSQANKERLRELIRQGRVLDEVRQSVKGLLEEEYQVPADILEAIKGSPEAWKFFQEFPAAYIRIRVAFIDGARKRPEEFQKRLRYFIDMTARNKKFGFGGIEKYYDK